MQWEYIFKVIHEQNSCVDATNLCNEMGVDGWEMTGVIDQTKHNAQGLDTKVFYFKRPKIIK